MKIKDYKCKCGHDDFFFSDNSNQTGIYCSRCGMWLKWADKNEQNLRMKQEHVLDKISAEIEEIETYDGIYIDRAYVLQIIDKYKAESEDTE